MESLAKGKARTDYEFEMKVSITTTHKEGLVVGMRSMPGNPYDGHTLEEALKRPPILSDHTPEIAVVDRGYNGRNQKRALEPIRWCTEQKIPVWNK